MESTYQHRNDNLQILRFVAAAIVLMTHITFYIHERVDTDVAVWHGGEYGVKIFFVISGFVMYLSGAKLPWDAQGAKVFLHRRVSRIFPLYWLITTVKVAVAVLVPVMVLHNNSPEPLRILASYVLFPMFNAEGEIRPIHGVGWTLLHEMLFYYIFSAAMMLRLSPFVFSTAAIVGMWMAGLFIEPQAAWAQVFTSEMNLLFVAGMALSALYRTRWRLPAVVGLPLMVLGGAGLLGVDIGPVQLTLLQAHDIGAVMVVAGALSVAMGAWGGLKPVLVSLGDSSYSLYLLHPILAPAICLVLAKLHVSSAWLILPIGSVACVVAASLLYRFIENPLNQLAKKHLEKVFFPAKPRVAGASNAQPLIDVIDDEPVELKQ